MIGTAEGVITAHSVRRKPESDRWVKDDVLAIVGTPEEPVPGSDAIQPPISVRVTIVSDVPASNPTTREISPPAVRSVRLYKADYDKYGHTTDCRACQLPIATGVMTKNHTVACRQRMEEAIAGEEEGQARLARAAERITGEVARRMQEIGEQEAEGDAMATDPAAMEREAMQEDTSAPAG